MDSLLSCPTYMHTTSANYKIRKTVLPYHYKTLLFYQNLKREEQLVYSSVVIISTKG